METNGYDVSDYKGFSIHEVDTMFKTNQSDMLITKTLENNEKTKIYISYYTSKILKEQNLTDMIDDLYNLNDILMPSDTLFIITKDTMTDTLMNAIKHIWEHDGIFVVIQSIKQLQYNILNHDMVYPHRILSDLEVQEVKKQYNILDNTQFPNISRFDPVAQAICIRPGQVCEIIRSSKTSITTKYYRLCINVK